MRFWERMYRLADAMETFIQHCDLCGNRVLYENLVDTGYKRWYACPRCWNEIQEVCDEAELDA